MEFKSKTYPREIQKSQNRIQSGKNIVDKFINTKNNSYKLIQTKTSYERSLIIEYIKEKELNFEIIKKEDETIKYIVSEDMELSSVFEYELTKPSKRYGWGYEDRGKIYYRKPICYIKIYNPSRAGSAR